MFKGFPYCKISTTKTVNILCLFLFVLLVLYISFLPGHYLFAKEEYASITGKDCQFCHTSPAGGADLSPTGEAFKRGGYKYPIPAESFRDLPLYKRVVRFFFGFLHLVAGIIWLGTIFYVHIIITPRSITRGLPKAEMILGVICIVITSITGIFLTIARLNHFSELFTTKFGIILSAKIFFFLLMVGIATVTITVIRRKMVGDIQSMERRSPHGSIFTHLDLLSFDGRGDKPAYVVEGGDVYDVSKSPLWKDGRHMGKHFAGKDLTQDLKSAPHGREVLEKFEKVGRLWHGPEDASLKPQRVRKAFLFLANSALVISFLILLCIAMWRWG